MLRITRHGTADGATTLEVEGSLAGAAVSELARSVEQCREAGQRVRLDLAAVGYVDADGTRLLRALLARDVQAVSRSHFIVGLLAGGQS